MKDLKPLIVQNDEGDVWVVFPEAGSEVVLDKFPLHIGPPAHAVPPPANDPMDRLILGRKGPEIQPFGRIGIQEFEKIVCPYPIIFFLQKPRSVQLSVRFHPRRGRPGTPEQLQTTAQLNPPLYVRDLRAVQQRLISLEPGRVYNPTHLKIPVFILEIEAVEVNVPICAVAVRVCA